MIVPGARHSEGVQPWLRRLSAGGHHRAGHHDSALYHQRIGNGAAGPFPGSMRRPVWRWVPRKRKHGSASVFTPPAAVWLPRWCWAWAGPSARPWPSSWWQVTCPICRVCSHRCAFSPPASSPAWPTPGGESLSSGALLHRAGAVSIYHAHQCIFKCVRQAQKGGLHGPASFSPPQGYDLGLLPVHDFLRRCDPAPC